MGHSGQEGHVELSGDGGQVVWVGHVGHGSEVMLEYSEQEGQPELSSQSEQFTAASVVYARQIGQDTLACVVQFGQVGQVTSTFVVHSG